MQLQTGPEESASVCTTDQTRSFPGLELAAWLPMEGDLRSPRLREPSQRAVAKSQDERTGAAETVCIPTGERNEGGTVRVRED